MKLSSFFFSLSRLTLTASVASVLVGCNEPKYPEPTPITTASTAQGSYLIVNAAPGAGNAQLLSIDNVAPTAAFAPVPYLGAATYNSVAAGQRLLRFSTATNLNSQQVVLRNAFSTNTNTTIFLTDAPTRPASGTDPGGVRTLVLADNIAAPAIASNARIRFVNLASGTINYGIYNVGGASLFSAVPNRAYRALTSGTGAAQINFANFTEVPARAYTLELRSSATASVAGTLQPVTFVAGKSYTLYVRGVANNSITPLGISVVQHN